MGYVNTTEKLKLPQWRWTQDHPDFVPDINDAFEAIDKFARESGGDYDTLKQQVEALATNFVDIQEGFNKLSEKVDNLEDLENNPEFQKVVTAVNELNTEIANLEESVTNNTSDITELKTKVSVLESDTSAIKSNIEAINTTLIDHGRSITNLETISSAQAGDITGLTSRVSTAETKIEANETAIDNVNTRVNTTNTKVAAVETSVEEAKSDITTVTARVGALEASQTTQDGKITALETASESASSTIEQHTTKLSELEAEDTALNARVGSVESKNITQDTEIDGLDARVEALETQMPTIGKDILGTIYFDFTPENEGETSGIRLIVLSDGSTLVTSVGLYIPAGGYTNFTPTVKFGDNISAAVDTSNLEFTGTGIVTDIIYDTGNGLRLISIIVYRNADNTSKKVTDVRFTMRVNADGPLKIDTIVPRISAFSIATIQRKPEALLNIVDTDFNREGDNNDGIQI